MHNELFFHFRHSRGLRFTFLCNYSRPGVYFEPIYSKGTSCVITVMCIMYQRMYFLMQNSRFLSPITASEKLEVEWTHVHDDAFMKWWSFCHSDFLNGDEAEDPHGMYGRRESYHFVDEPWRFCDCRYYAKSGLLWHYTTVMTIQK